MKCFHCINVVCHTEYPPNAIVSVCPRCLWRSKEQQLPSKIPPVQQVSLVNQPKSNIFDDIYINNEVRVESMTQKVCPIGWCPSNDECLLPKYHQLLAESPAIDKRLLGVKENE